MSDHALGLRLRQLLVAHPGSTPATSPGAPGSPGAAPLPDGRRLQALVGDLCRHDQQELLPPLRHLVLAPAFQSALRTTPPLADPRCRPRMMQELRAVFTPALCQRMEAVVDGLLGLDAPAGPGTSPLAEAAAAGDGPARSRPSRGVSPVLLAVAMAAALALGVAVARFWWAEDAAPEYPVPMGQGWSGPPGQDAGPASVLPPDPAGSSRLEGAPQPGEGTAPAVADPQPPPLPPLPSSGSGAGAGAPAPGGETDQATTVAATNQVQELYASLSRHDFNAARGIFSAEVADQFEPAFFRQFARVEVADLQPIGRSATTVTLQGQVRFVYPDGSSQLESRSFTLSTLDNPPRVIGSAFGAVLRPREAAP